MGRLCFLQIVLWKKVGRSGDGKQNKLLEINKKHVLALDSVTVKTDFSALKIVQRYSVLKTLTFWYS